MSEPRPSLDGRYFEDIYARSIDPWGFRTSPYERDKYAATLGILTRGTYRSALEVGCSIGVFTGRLAERCEALLALDASSTALAAAVEANRDRPAVAFREATLPRDFPPGTFDLIVLSEVVYYLSRADAAALAARCLSALSPDGEIVLCHWLGETDYPLSGDAAAELFIASTSPPLRRGAARRTPDYRLDLLAASR